MKATTLRKVSAVASLLSVVLLAATLTLPYLKVPQSVQQTVRPVTGNATSYQVYGYGIPPVNAGSEFNVTLSGYKPYALEYTLTPTEGNKILPAIALGRVNNGSSYSFGATAEANYALELTVIAYNESGYTINYAGTWAPYNDSVVYTAPSVLLLTASLIATYYFGTRIERQLNEERVEKELEEAKTARSS